MSSQSMSLDSEEGRAFLQARVARFGRTAGGLSTFFLVGSCAVIMATEPGVHFLDFALHRATSFHVLGALLGFVMWFLVRRGTWSVRALVVADGAFIVGSLASYSAMVVTARAHAIDRADLILILIATFTLLPRSVLIPSSGTRTAVVGILAGLPVIVASLLIGHQLEQQGRLPYTTPLNSLLWYVGAIFVAAFTSRVIYGLRQEVAQAQLLGQYVLDERIGEGGMGIVYRARHALLRRPTAIKLLPAEKAGLENLARFEREVQLTSRLTHPNTIAVFDFGRTPDGVFYYAMEYLDGIDLEMLVEHHGKQAPARVVHVLLQMCGSLAEAHGLGMVHRDIKPANVFLCERGGVADVVKVLDFGLVKDTLRPTEQTALSRVDTILGTPMYLAPEAITSPELVDARSDLYAVGAVAYRLLTGQHVFSSKSIVEVCAAHIHTRPKNPRDVGGSDIPEALADLVLACLAKKPADRPQSAAAVRAALFDLALAPWSESDARTWWTEHANALRAARKTASAAVSGLHPHSLSIDFARRAG